MIMIFGTVVWNDISMCFFHFFKILIFRVVRGLNGRNFSPSLFISQEPCIIWLSVIVHLSKMIQSPRFFHFFKVLIFCVYNVKVQKTVQNDKILSVALQISGTIHHMIIIYGAHVWNVNIFRRFFSIFQNFDFLGGQRGERAKWAKMTKNSVCRTLYFRSHISWSSFMVHMYV